MALRSDGFVDIDIHTLESVLSRETLNCKESYIWDAALRWASAECIRQDLEPNPTNQRQLLGKICTFNNFFLSEQISIHYTYMMSVCVCMISWICLYSLIVRACVRAII